MKVYEGPLMFQKEKDWMLMEILLGIITPASWNGIF